MAAPVLPTTAPLNVLEAAQPVLSASEARQFAESVHIRTGSSSSDASAAAPDSTTAAAGDGEEPYYWEDGGDVAPPLPKVLAHNVHWLGFKLWTSVEFVGEFFADFLGLYNSRYEWALDMENRRLEEIEEREEAEERKRRWEEIHRLNTAAGVATATPSSAAAAAVRAGADTGAGTGAASAAAPVVPEAVAEVAAEAGTGGPAAAPSASQVPVEGGQEQETA